MTKYFFPAACLLLLFSLYSVFAGGRKADSAPLLAYPPSPPFEISVNESERQWDAEAVYFLAQAETPQGEEAQSRAEIVVRALAASYPDRIGEPEFFDGDWTIKVYGERFYYAEGRLLPASLKDRANDFSPLSFYSYQKELPPFVLTNPEQSARMREQESQRNERTMQRGRSPHFFDALHRARSHEEAYERVKSMRFLGHTVMVHYSILTVLSLVEEQILKASRTSATVRQWINNLNTVEGWAWRNVASSQSRSYHAYGVAIDLLPRSLGGLQTYWLWTSQHTPEWWNVPYTRRFHPPKEVIDAFEAFGFIWGGKWRYFDTMHFEYRPEVFALNGLPLMDLRDLR